MIEVSFVCLQKHMTLQNYRSEGQNNGLPGPFKVLNVFNGNPFGWAPRNLNFCKE